MELRSLLKSKKDCDAKNMETIKLHICRDSIYFYGDIKHCMMILGSKILSPSKVARTYIILYFLMLACMKNSNEKSITSTSHLF